MSKPNRTLQAYLTAILTVLLDQLSKIGIVAALALGHSTPLVDGFLHLTYVQNFGAAFSLFTGQTAMLCLVAIAAVLTVAAYLRRARPQDPLSLLALGLLMGGALGNLIDRVWLGYVRDMIDLRWHGQTIWPIFNVADIAVVTASLLFLWVAFRVPRQTGSI